VVDNALKKIGEECNKGDNEHTELSKHICKILLEFEEKELHGSRLHTDIDTRISEESWARMNEASEEKEGSSFVTDMMNTYEHTWEAQEEASKSFDNWKEKKYHSTLDKILQQCLKDENQHMQFSQSISNIIRESQEKEKQLKIDYTVELIAFYERVLQEINECQVLSAYPKIMDAIRIVLGSEVSIICDFDILRMKDLSQI
jgi:hypothetical protein